jgi:hypothetical protein
VTDSPRSTDALAEDRSVLVRFSVEVARLLGLDAEAFSALNPDALPPIVATIRATPSGVSPS